MALTQAQGLLLSNDILVKGIMEDDPKPDQLRQWLQWCEIDGDTERWANPSAQLANATPYAFGAAITEQTTIPAARTYTFAQIGTGRSVNYQTQDNQSNVNDQAAVQLEMGVRNILYEISRQLISGNVATPGEFSGFETIVNAAPFSTTQILDAGGGALTTAHIDRILRRITQGEGYNTCLYTSPNGYNAIREAYLTRGTLPQQEFISVPSGSGKTTRMAVTHVDGVPVLWSSQVPADAAVAATNRIFALKLGPKHIHGIIPARNGRRSMIKVRSSIVVGSSASRFDMTFTGAISVPSVRDVAVIKNFTVAAI